MVNINCPIAKNLMPLYLDNNLYQDDALALKMHMQSCTKCAEEFRLYRDAFAELRRAGDEIRAISWPDISKNVIAELPATHVETAQQTTAVIRPAFRLKFALQTAACLLIGITAGFMAFRQVYNPVPEQRMKTDPALVRANFPELGVQINKLSEPLPTHFSTPGGVMVTNVAENGPAASAGIKQWDVIYEINNCPISGIDELHRIFTEHRKSREELKFAVIHKNGKKEVYTVKLNK